MSVCMRRGGVYVCMLDERMVSVFYSNDTRVVQCYVTIQQLWMVWLDDPRIRVVVVPLCLLSRPCT